MSCRRAFTLPETIAAVVILSIGMPPMLWAMRKAHVERTQPVQVSRARWLATARLEDVIADRHSGTRGWAYVLDGSYPLEDPVSGWTDFERSVDVTETAADLVSAGTGYKTVEVSVSWTDSTGDAQTLTISTVLTEYDP